MSEKLIARGRLGEVRARTSCFTPVPGIRRSSIVASPFVWTCDLDAGRDVAPR